MAKSVPNDMPMAIPASVAQARPSVQSAAVSGWVTLVSDITKFLTVEQPNSVRADQKGIRIGTFMVEHADITAVVNTKQAELQGFLSDSTTPDVTVSVTYFENWASTVQGLLLHAKPQTVEEVCNLVLGAREFGLKVGCGGAYHSWSPLFPDASTTSQQGLLINTCDIQLQQGNNQRITLNGDSTAITIVPGVTTGELMAFFLDNGVCFESDVILMNVTYGGILSTGCHGVGKDQQAMSDWIQSMKVVDHTGVVHTYPDDFPITYSDEDKTAAMNVMRVNMGVFGVNVEFTVAVKPLIGANITNTFPKLSRMFYGPNPMLKQLLNDNWSVQCLWFPFNSLGLIGGAVQSLPLTNIWQPMTDEVWVRTINKLDDAAIETNRFEKLVQKMKDAAQHILLDQFASPLISRYPQFVPIIGGTSLNLLKPNLPPDDDEELPFAIHFRYAISLAPVYDLEFAFPLTLGASNDGFETLFNAIRYVVEEAKNEATGFLAAYPFSTTLDVRIIQKSTALMCPATSPAGDTSTHTAFVEILSFAGTQGYIDFFQKVGEYWTSLGGVPHWCKQWTFLGDSVFDKIHEHYGDRIPVFNKVLTDLGDPNTKTFINHTMERVLLLDDAAGPGGKERKEKKEKKEKKKPSKS